MTPVNPRSSRRSKPPRHNHQFSRTGIRKRLVGLTLLGFFVAGGFWVRYGTFQGVPNLILIKFLSDDQARSAYFSGQPQILHDRLRNMGIEEDIKAFYRDQYPDEVELDWFIHQLLYERSGYIGKAYKITQNGQLALKTPKDRAFPRWLVLARKAGVVQDSREESGVQWVMLPNGHFVTYYALSDVYPIKTLRQLIREQRRSK